MCGLGQFPPELKGRFNVALAIGFLLPVQANPSVFGEMIDALKSDEDGHLIFTVRQKHMESGSTRQS